jgi:hypothetical protein
MKSAKQYILERYLHSTPEEERELFWKTDGIVYVRDVEDIVCGYAEMILDEFLKTIEDGIETGETNPVLGNIVRYPIITNYEDGTQWINEDIVKLFKEKYIQ